MMISVKGVVFFIYVCSFYFFVKCGCCYNKHSTNDKDSINCEDKKDDNKKDERKDDDKIISDIKEISGYKFNNSSNLFHMTDEYKSKIDNVLGNIGEENRIFIQSDTEGKLFSIYYGLFIAGIITKIDTSKKIYYDIKTGDFSDNCEKKDLWINYVEINKDFKGTYIHCGDILDRCQKTNGCMDCLLLLLYIKKQLKDHVKLICGNHEIMINYTVKNCCKKSDILTTIVAQALKKGWLKYIDDIKIGYDDFILTHKELTIRDIFRIYNFVKELRGEKLKYDINELKNIVKKLDEYDISNTMYHDLGIGDDFTKAIFDVKNDFNKLFSNFIYNNVDKKGINSDIAKYFEHCRKDDVIVNKNDIDLEDHIGSLGKQICGHIHMEYNECYFKKSKILYVDNYSTSYTNGTSGDFRMNLHIIDKTIDIENDKIVCIFNKSSDNFKIYDIKTNKYVC